MTDIEFARKVAKLVDTGHGDTYENLYKLVEERFTSTNSAMLKLLNDTHGYLFTYGHMNKAAGADFLSRYNAVQAQLQA
jgi:hypothetical protein